MEKIDNNELNNFVGIIKERIDLFYGTRATLEREITISEQKGDYNSVVTKSNKKYLDFVNNEISRLSQLACVFAKERTEAMSDVELEQYRNQAVNFLKKMVDIHDEVSGKAFYEDKLKKLQNSPVENCREDLKTFVSISCTYNHGIFTTINNDKQDYERRYNTTLKHMMNHIKDSALERETELNAMLNSDTEVIDVNNLENSNGNNQIKH